MTNPTSLTVEQRLLPCPNALCDYSRPHLNETDADLNATHTWVSCENCGASGPRIENPSQFYGRTAEWDQVKQAVIAAWNTRHLTSTDRLRDALEDIVNPLGYLKREAEAKGSQLGGMAYQIANDPAFLQRIAREALTSAPAPSGEREALEKIDAEAPLKEPPASRTVGFDHIMEDPSEANAIVDEAFHEGFVRGLWQAAQIARAALQGHAS